MKSLIGLLSLGALSFGGSSIETQSKWNENKNITFNEVVETELEEDNLETYTYNKTSNFSNSYVSLFKNKDQSIDITFNIKRMFDEIVELAKKHGQIKEENKKKSFYTQIKDDLLVDASSLLNSSKVYVKVKDDTEEKTLYLNSVCGLKILTQTQNKCTILPLGIVKEMHFQLSLNPRTWTFYRKSAVRINNTYGFISDSNPEQNAFYGMEIFNNTKVVESGIGDFVNLEDELSIWEKDEVSPNVNANFSNTIWANQNSLKKNLKKGQNVTATFDFDDIVEVPFPPFLLYVPMILFVSPIAYYGIRKAAKI